MKNLLLSIIVIVILCTNLNAIASCESESVDKVNVSINVNHVLRHNVPKTLFGFNLPWYAFQYGLQKDGVPKSKLIELLRPFSGALYRFPGGSPSNTYDWKNSIKPLSQRMPMPFEYGIKRIPEFGYDEFFKFVKQVNGQAIVTLNLVGTDVSADPSEKVSSSARQFVEWVLEESSMRCIGSELCPVQYLELGNELDWTPYLWSSEVYAARANEIIKSVGNKVPNKAWVANGKTAPWGMVNKKEGFQKFNKSISELLPLEIEHLAYHPYYDGNSIPVTMKYAGAYFDEWSKNRKSASIMVTEHARWPSRPSTGNWKDNWYQATGQGGAISTADFILTIIPDSRISAAVWHGLSTFGPWQLVRWDEKQDILYPSPVYWALRTLREAFLLDTIEVLPNKLKGAYSGGYDQHFLAMKGNGKISFSGVNRSKHSVVINLKWLGGTLKHANGKLNITNQNNVNDIVDDNDDLNKSRIVMNQVFLKNVVKDFKSTLCIPARSVFSLVI